MSAWILFWTVILVFGIGAFALSVVAIIPLGGKDIVELLRRLGRRVGDEE